MSPPPEMALFIGRLHPLLVHLPIGLLVLLVFLEVIARFQKFRHANASSGLILALAVPAALVTVVCGWLLSLGGGYEERLLQWHKWTGIGTAAACLLAGLLYSLNRKTAYFWCLVLSGLTLVVASHFGGSLTHGSDYLVRYAPAPIRAWLNPSGSTTLAQKEKEKLTNSASDKNVFSSVIQPVFQQNCIACHGPEKSKGKLRLDSIEGLLKGGENGPVLVAGKSAESELLRRLRLPLDSDDHMPPAGKPQPSASDIALLAWWIAAGAPADKNLSDLRPPLAVARILEARFGSAHGAAEPVATPPPKPLAQVLPGANALADELGIAISALSPNEPWLQCNAAVAGTNFGDIQLARLVPLGPNIRWLDLAGTGITDAGLQHLASMVHLKRLHLERTSLGDSAIANIASLQSLEYLNLYGTGVTDAGLEGLKSLGHLKQLYLWQTKVTPGAVASFVEVRTDKIEIQRVQDEIDALSAKLRDLHVTVELGMMATNRTTNVPAINTNCPVSGKPVDVTKTVWHEGALVAFCCDDCKAKFQQDAGQFLAKLGPLPKPETPQASK